MRTTHGDGPAPDFRAVFEATPTPFLVVAPPDYVIVAVNDAYLRATSTARAAIVGRRLFDVFPDDPDDPAASGVANLGASLARVVATGRADAMAVQRYPIPADRIPADRTSRPAGDGAEVGREVGRAFEERWWSPVNVPVLGPGGEVTHVVHRVEDVTELVRLRDAGAARDRLARDQQAAIDGLRAANAAAAEAAARERAAEARTRAVLAHLPGAAAFVVDHDLRYLLAAGDALDAAGFAPEAFVGRTMREVVGPALAEVGEPLFRRALAGEAFTSEHEQGGRAFLSHGGPLRDAAGRVEAAVAVSTDITERRAAEAALRASEAKYRTLFDSIDEGFTTVEMLFDADGRPADLRYLETNRAFERHTGFADLTGRTAREVLPQLEDAWVDAYARVARTGEPLRVEQYNGDTGRWFDVYLARVGGAGSRVVAAVFADVTARRRAEAALQASEARQAVLLALSDALRPLDDAAAIRLTAAEVLGRHLGASRVAYAEDCGDGEHYEVTPNYVDGVADAAGRFRYADYGADLLADLRAGRARVQPDIQNDERLTDAERRALAAYGVGASLNVSLVKQGRLVTFLGVNYATAHDFPRDEVELVREVAERTWAAVERARTETALRESEANYRTLFDSIDEGFCVIEVLFDADDRPADYRFLQANPAFVRQTGLDDAIGRTMRELWPQQEAYWFELYGRVARTGVPERYENQVGARGGHWFDVYAFRVGAPDQRHVGILFQDVTARKQAEERLRASEARQTFLLTLSDALRPLADPLAVQAAACRVLGEHLGANRVLYAETADGAGAPALVRAVDYTNGVPSRVGWHRLDDYGPWVTEIWRAGRNLLWNTLDDLPDLPAAERAAYEAVEIEAIIGVPLLKDGRFTAFLAVHQATPRTWTPDEIALVEATVERTWAAAEQARAEAALAASEEKFRTLFASIDEGVGLVEVVFDAHGVVRDGVVLEVNDALARMPGLDDVVGRSLSEFAPNFEAYWLTAYGRVATTGRSERVENYSADIDRWLTAYFSRVGGEGSRLVSVVFDDITERKRREADLAFLADVSQDLVRLTDLDETMRVFGAKLGAHFGLSSCSFAEVDEAADAARITHEWHRAGLPDLVGAYRIEDFMSEAFQRASRAGEVTVVRDTAADPRTDAGRYAALGIGAFLSVPLVRDGAWRFVLAVCRPAPSDWRDDEVALVRELAGRVWARLERARAEDALRASEERYRLIVEGARDYAIVTTDPEGRVTSWSPGAEAAFGWPTAEAVGRPVAITFTPEDRAAGVPDAELAAARAGGVAPDVRWHACRDGSRVFIEGTVRALRDERGRLRHFLKVGQDVTARRRLDEALRASEARVRTLVENVRDYAIFLLDAEGRVTEWPAGAERVKGYRADEVVGRHLALFYAPEDVAAGVPARHLAEAAAAGRGEWEGWRVRKDGSRFWANEIATAIRDGEGRLVGFTKISRDLTERRLTEQAAEQAQLQAARDELRRALAAAEEAERRRLARELHDQLGQHLTAFALGLGEARRRLGAAAPDAAASLVRLEESARLMTRDARTLALELRPPELDDVGLVSALDTYVRAWGERTGVAAELAVTGLQERGVPAEVGSALYRILQEALTNVTKHAGATRVSVIVEQPDGEVGLIVEDDGRGFDADATAVRARQERRLGLAGMRERAALVGGTVAIESSPGGGTTVYVRLPLHPASVPPAERQVGGAADGGERA